MAVEFVEVGGVDLHVTIVFKCKKLLIILFCFLVVCEMILNGS